MGYRGILRSIQAEINRAERNARRRQRELDRQQKAYEKMQELARASYEVECYENKIALLLSVHKECGVFWDWEKIRSTRPPLKPSLRHHFESAAQVQLDCYEPGFFTKLFGRVEKKRDGLKKRVDAAKKQDETVYKNALTKFEDDYNKWEETNCLAGRICTGDTSAYYEAVKEINPFCEINQLGSSVKFAFIDGSIIEIELKPNSEKVIPANVKGLLKSGKLSVKKMPRSQFYELYQDYVCSCLIRVSREIFALLPVKMAIVHVNADVLNSRTGFMEDSTILSAAVPRKTIEGLNLDQLDPSDSMENFVHHMDFKKQKGFEAVAKIDPSTFNQ